MKKLTETLYIIDYVNDTLEDIKTAELGRLKGLFKELSDTNKLCSDIGSAVVAEFEFKGNLDDVIKQLSDLIEYYKAHDFEEKDRMMLLANSDRLKAHQLKEHNDYYQVQSRENILTNLDEAGKYIQALKDRRKVLHEKKECLCHCN